MYCEIKFSLTFYLFNATSSVSARFACRIVVVSMPDSRVVSWANEILHIYFIFCIRFQIDQSLHH